MPVIQIQFCLLDPDFACASSAHARAESWILVTNNEREFMRVEGLQVALSKIGNHQSQEK